MNTQNSRKGGCREVLDSRADTTMFLAVPAEARVKLKDDKLVGMVMRTEAGMDEVEDDKVSRSEDGG